MKQVQTIAWLAVIFLASMPAIAKDQKQKDVSDVFDAAPAKVYDAAYKYAQHHGVIKYSDDKHMTITVLVHIPGGGWSYAKDYDCTISVEALEQNKSQVHVVGQYTTKQTTFSDLRKKNSPAVKVVEGIREQFDQSK